MPEDTWLAILIVFFVIPTILLALRIYADTSRYMRSGCLASSVISLIFAIAAYLFFAIACAMTFYRARRKMRGMDRGPDPSDMGRIPYMAALGQPLREATIVHSYIVTTGLWLCKGSFVAMYFNLKRHLNKTSKRLLYGTVVYLILSYLVLILTHALWCGKSFGKQWASTSKSYCTPFTSTVSISIYAFCNITSDLLVLTLPLVILHYITVLPREKYAIVFLLVLGLGTIATTGTCCGLHITYRHELVVYYSFIQLAELLACIELAVAIACVSLPSLRAVLYRKRESQKARIKSLVGESKHSSTGAPTHHERVADWDDWDEDEGRLVIMRRMSYDVESIEVPAPVRTASPREPIRTASPQALSRMASPWEPVRTPSPREPESGLPGQAI